ncbi:helix-turn-helix transcriptional regulator [Actinomadura graeca]|uniref:Helix-turn-helix transcriptional regulator n=1 Tax=Actinomadura graeca TaxID=2750812 RepID=A0ABX8QWZ1_9ACTN|nr:helix-turn-helix transcriptional regulator [Actinomadura graeca]QXJ23295.1 helix-turn-helix transcriptional regulator [Actinomadura graeca]
MRAQLAYTMRLWREIKGLSQDGLAKELYTTRETVTAYETQRNRPDQEFCKKLDEFFGTGELFQGLWHHAQREHLREWFEAYVAHENESSEIRTFQPLYIPGLLQTEGYMRATSPKGRVDEELIARRLARRDILTRDGDPPHLFVVLDHAAILRRSRDGGVIVEQLHHLLCAGEMPQVHIQAVRISDGWYRGLDGPMVVLTKPDRHRVGYVEAQFGGRLIEDQAEVARLGIRFDEIRCQALSEEASRALIQKTMETMRHDPLA